MGSGGNAVISVSGHMSLYPFILNGYSDVKK